MKKFISRTVLLPLCLSAFVIGCETASTTAPAGFLRDYSVLQEGTYFKQEYIAPDIDFSKYTSVKVAPVNFDYLMNRTVCSPEDLENLGKAFRRDIEKSLKEKGFNITHAPSGNTLIVCAAITNVEIPDRLFNAAKSLAPYGLSMIPTDTDGRTAFEAKIIDAKTGKTVIELGEQQAGAGGQIDIAAMAVGGYMKFVNANVVYRKWANQVAKMLSELKKK